MCFGRKGCCRNQEAGLDSALIRIDTGDELVDIGVGHGRRQRFFESGGPFRRHCRPVDGEQFRAEGLGESVADKFRRNTADDGVGLDVFCDDGSGGDDGSLADGDAGENGRTHADPDVVLYDNGTFADVLAFRIDGIVGPEGVGRDCVRAVLAAEHEADFWPNGDVAADHQFGV